MKKLRKEKLLILDEWLLYPLKEAEARDVLELVEARNKVASTIFCSQYDTSEWHVNLYDPTLADAICDRIIYNAYTIQSRRIHAKAQGYPRVIPRMAAPVHHASGRHAPFRRNGAPFQRWRCTIIRGQVALLGRHMHGIDGIFRLRHAVLFTGRADFFNATSPASQ